MSSVTPMVTTSDDRDSPVPTRGGLAAAHLRVRTRLAGPGEWWAGAVRVAVAEETRAAVDRS